jgi:hypothetical protein
VQAPQKNDPQAIRFDPPIPCDGQANNAPAAQLAAHRVAQARFPRGPFSLETNCFIHKGNFSVHWQQSQLDSETPDAYKPRFFGLAE